MVKKEKVVSVNVNVVSPDVTDLELPSVQEAFVINTHDDLVKYKSLQDSYKTHIKNIALRFDKTRKSAHKAWQDICALEKDFKEPFEKAIDQIEKNGITFLKKVQKEEEDAKKLEQANKAKEILDEARGLDETQKNIDILKTIGEDSLAQKLEAELNNKKQDLSNALHSTLQQTSETDLKDLAVGVKTRTTYKVEVTDKMALIKAIAEGKLSADLVDVNTSAIQELAKGMTGDGIEVCAGVVLRKNIGFTK